VHPVIYGDNVHLSVKRTPEFQGHMTPQNARKTRSFKIRKRRLAHSSWSTKMRPIWAWKCDISGTKATACISSCLGGAPFNMAGPISSVSTVKQ
jgi:hypothetical protein